MSTNNLKEKYEEEELDGYGKISTIYSAIVLIIGAIRLIIAIIY